MSPRVRTVIALAAAATIGGGCRRAVPEPGVSADLARERAGAIRDLRYDLQIRIPERRSDPVTGRVEITFSWVASPRSLVLDFQAPAGNVRSVMVAGQAVPFTTPEDHIVIPADALTAGAQSVTVEFIATDAALNRQDDFLYALFVPNRASTAFPVFDQPDLKARYRLTMAVPAGWTAIGNGSLTARDSVDGPVARFAETAPISTYLFTFAAGKLSEERAERDGRLLTMYHRETDSTKLARNRDAIFDLHAASLRWLEAYTGIPYPFEKFAFLAVPSFQFGGMEHPGAVWYRAESLFLDPTASRNQELGRASVIAHETAHMWFGDLVTMRWFDDVWMKEVFANFMAARIVGPSFPDIDQDLRFFQAHHVGAYGVDRTAGTNPIRQPLGNLREAGSLYGAIIYQKAPVVMRQLELLVGDSTFREGLRRYLTRYRFGNAAWPELIAILDELSEEDLAAWSRAWVEEPGRPTITAEWVDSGLVVSQSDPVPARNLRWTQPIAVAFGGPDSVATRRVSLRGAQALVPRAPRGGFVLPGVDGVGYGRFRLDSTSRQLLLTDIGRLPTAVARSVGWQTLWEEVLDGTLPPARFLAAALAALPAEPAELVGLQLVGLIGGGYWRYLTDAERRALAPTVERVFWAELERATTPGRKGAFFNAIVGATLTSDGVARLERIWRKAETPPGLPLMEAQYVDLAEALALRSVAGAEAILTEQESRISNPDRLARFRFVRPALSADSAVRDSVFRSLASLDNRRRENWVLDVMGALNHPLRATSSLARLGPSLDLGLEIQRTGDIFFPLGWFSAALGGHQSAAAADTVVRFLERHPDYPARLRGKLLQAADGLFRAAAITDGWRSPRSVAR